MQFTLHTTVYVSNFYATVEELSITSSEMNWWKSKENYLIFKSGINITYVILVTTFLFFMEFCRNTFYQRCSN